MLLWLWQKRRKRKEESLVSVFWRQDSNANPPGAEEDIAKGHVGEHKLLAAGAADGECGTTTRRLLRQVDLYDKPANNELNWEM